MRTLAERLSSHRAAIAVAMVLLVSLGSLCVHARYYPLFLADDALISLRYASRLLEGNGLNWTDGHPVEGYSNLSWTLLVALLGALGMDLIDATRVLGALCMTSVTVSAALWYARRHAPREMGLPLAIGVLFFCWSAPTAVWMVGGLEQPLCAALVGAMVPLAFALMAADSPQVVPRRVLSLVLGLMCLTRPDGPLFTVAIVVSIAFARRLSGYGWPWREGVLVATFPCCCYIGQALFRFGYYGEWVPNTALVKIAPSVEHLRGGVAYVGQGILALAPWSFVAVICAVGLLFVQQTRPRGIVLLTLAGLWLGYIAAVGGDIFPAYRHFVPAVVVFMYAIIEAGRIVWAVALRRSAAWRWVFCGAVATCFAFFVPIQFSNSENRRAKAERWVWDGQVVGLLLKRAFSDRQPLLAVTAAGCLPYWSELPALDMLGLNDYYLPRHRPVDMGRGWIGHELGDGAYVLSRKPDIIAFHTGVSDLLFRSGEEMRHMPEFINEYALVKFRGSVPYELEAFLYVRRHSPTIGIRESSGEIVVPGFLFNGNPDTLAYLNQHGELVVPVSADSPARIELPSELPLEDWRPEVRGSAPAEIQVSLQRTGGPVSIGLTSVSKVPVEVKELALRGIPLKCPPPIKPQFDQASVTPPIPPK